MSCPIYSSQPLYYNGYYHRPHFRDEEREAERCSQGAYSYHLSAYLGDLTQPSSLAYEVGTIISQTWKLRHREGK